MKIIENHAAPNPRRVRIFLAEKGLTVPFESFEMTLENLRSDWFTSLNPTQRVPILVLDDGTAISESVAICRYFEELHPEPPLFGTGALERAQIEMWNRRIEHGLFFHVAQTFRHLHPRMAAREVPQIADWGEANKGKAIEALRILDHQLTRHRYVAGSHFSIADITSLVAVDFMSVARIDIPADAAALRRWHAEVTARPSASA